MLVPGDRWNIFYHFFFFLVELCWPVAFQFRLYNYQCSFFALLFVCYVNIKGALRIRTQYVCMWSNTKDSPLFTKETILVYMSLLFFLFVCQKKKKLNLAFYIGKTLVNLVTLHQPLSRRCTHTYSHSIDVLLNSSVCVCVYLSGGGLLHRV